jgi:hypothetical protein
MSVDLKAIDLKTVTAADALAEVVREMRLRAGVYPKWLEAGKMTDDVATKQYGGMKKAHQMLDWLAKQDTDELRLGAALVKMFKQNIGGFGDAIQDDLVKQLGTAFPGGKLHAIREKAKEAA